MELREIAEQGWVEATPPMIDDGDNVIARVNGVPINGGVKIETIEQSDTEFHERYSTGPYRVDLRVTLESAHVKVVRSDAY